MVKTFRFLSRHGRALAGLALGAALVAIFVGGAQPFAVNLIPSPWDKFAHVAVFAGLGTVCGIAFGIRNASVVFLAAASSLCIGALDEWHQAMLPGRNAGWDDFVADAVGALIAAFLVRHLRAVLRKQSTGL